MIALLSSAANPQVAPMWLEDQGAAASGTPWGWLVWGGAVAAGLVLLAVGATLRAERVRRDPGGHALRVVAGRLGADRALLRELGAFAPEDGGAPVLSMLVSDHALRTAVESARRPLTPGMARLLAARGVGLPAAAPPAQRGSGPKVAGKPASQARVGR